MSMVETPRIVAPRKWSALVVSVTCTALGEVPPAVKRWAAGVALRVNLTQRDAREC
jgi:hypothetical protein